MENLNLECLKQITILYAEDDLVIQKQTLGILQNLVKKVHVANCGQEAVELYDNNSVDIIITDITMPNMSGIEFSKHVRKNNRDIPIIVISAHNDSNILIEAIEIGISRFILKPLNISDLIQVITQFAENICNKSEKDSVSNLLEQYKNIVDADSIVSKTNKHGIITYVNDRFVDISGYTKEELIGQHHNIIRHPDTPEKIFKKMWITISEKKKVWQGVVKNLSKQGKSYYVRSTIKPILDMNGDIIEYIAIRQDITPQEKTRKFLQKQNVQKISNLNDALKNQEQYENVINQINIVSRFNLQGKITYVNDRFCQLIEYTKDELIGQTFKLIRHEKTNIETSRQMWKTIKSGKTWSGKLMNKSKTGKTFHLDAVISPIFNQNNEIIEFISVCHNITSIIELHKELEDTQREIIYRMGEIGETRSKETGNHVKRVAEYSKLLGKLCGLKQNDIDIIFMASPMHDIGKVGIPDSVLNKPGKLNEEEWEIMKEHSELGYNILKNSKREILKAAAIISYHHHEKWNGSGYPQGLKEEEIHIFGRITAIADVFDALGSDRCYKKAWELDKILELFKEQKGKHFDPKLIELFFDNLDEFLKIRDTYVD
ncbi:regulator [Arcobacter sp. CECT 8989]|uniref:response regulator n=1 Tax=Arcobacter sp. CECT 8989 TaxID=2044509 RepID=UPI00100A5770|nr:PAS domain S-box protein [Arcobacter sp. CECT 8989]RXK01952.1 regulator [Arcobacter sp. CECT 8989]